MKYSLTSTLLVFSGVYWIPGLMTNIIALKFGLLFAVIAINRFSLKRKLALHMAVLLCALIPFVFQGDNHLGAFQYVTSTFFGLIMIVVGFKTNENDLSLLLKWVPVLTFLLLILYVFTLLSGYVNPWNGYFFIKTGFNAKSTGWSIFLFQVVSLNLLSYHYTQKRKWYSFGIILVLISLQVLAEGRSGLLASLILIVLSLYNQKIGFIAKLKGKIVFLFFTVLVASFFSEEIIAYLARDLQEFDLNKLSTNRWLQYAILPQIVWSDILIAGGGYQSTISLFRDFQGIPLEFHNHPVRVILDHGVLNGGIIIFSLLSIIVDSLMFKPIRFFFMAAALIVFTEPNVLVGSFWNSMVIWWMIGIGLSKQVREQKYNHIENSIISNGNS